MQVLFLHTNFPAQYRHLAALLARDRDNRVIFGTTASNGAIPGVQKALFKAHREVRPETHHYIRPLEHATLNGQAVVRTLAPLKKEGFRPDVICAHSGWGAGMFVKDLFPDAGLLDYFEWYYRADGSDADFLDGPASDDSRLRIRTKNAPILLDLAACDWGLSPTEWQRAQFPAFLAERISVLHDGVDTGYFAPQPGARLMLPQLDLSDCDELITYVARGMEPYRGFPQFIRAAALLQRRRPNAHMVVVGADRVAYGSRLPDGRTYKQKMLEEVELDPARIHFTGLLPYAQYREVLRASAVHVYLTVPFVLSWSMIEAMAAGCLVLGSDTAPVREVIEDGRTGLLVDFFSPERIADRVVEVLEHPDRMAAIRAAARAHVQARYDQRDLLPRHVGLLRDVAARNLPPRQLGDDAAAAG